MVKVTSILPGHLFFKNVTMEALMKKFVMLLCVLVLVFGCSKKKYVSSLDDTATTTKSGIEEGTGLDTELSDSEKYGQMQEEDVEEDRLLSERSPKGYGIEGEDNESYYDDSSRSPFKDIYFAFDKYEISEEAAGVLESVADWLHRHNDAKILIEGHCDSRGTNEYNLALGERRARAVKDYLIFSGIGKNKMNTLSYGEERQVCSEQDESCYIKNRRAHIVLSQ